jgi:hypothetical protein
MSLLLNLNATSSVTLLVVSKDLTHRRKQCLLGSSTTRNVRCSPLIVGSPSHVQGFTDLSHGPQLPSLKTFHRGVHIRYSRDKEASCLTAV